MTALTTDLETPAVIVHLDVMEDNIRRVQAHLDRHRVANRPHIKTHKIPAIGKMQMAAGAVGITCQKLGEVEVFAAAGVADDVLLTYNILGPAKTRSEEHTSELQSQFHLVCRLLLEKKKSADN